jgi:hypothetical protein
MTTITTTVTTDPVYSQAVGAQTSMFIALATVKDMGALQNTAYEFEDAMNGLSGELLSIDMNLLTIVRSQNEAIVSRGTSLGISINLHESMLPLESVVTTVLVTELGKKLYPLTTSVTIEKEIVTTSGDLTNQSANVVNSGDDTIAAEVDEVDPLFDELDLEASVPDTEDLASIQSEPRKLLPDFMIEAALECAANTGGIEPGLVAFSHNPLAELINNSIDLVLSYTANNYAGLNVALSQIASNSNLTNQYLAFQYALGGGDGLAGSVAQLDAFLSHTNRLSGLTLDKSNPFATPDGDSTTEESTYSANTANITYTILSFDANRFRSAKYFVQATCAREHQLSELYIIHDNVYPYVREVGTTYTQDPYVDFSASLVNGTLSILAKSQKPNTNYVIHGVRLKIDKTGLAYTDISQEKILQNGQLLAAYLQDDTDYVAYQSRSLVKGYVVANLARELRDMINQFSSDAFNGQSVGLKQAYLTDAAAIITTRNLLIQSSIDADWTAFEDVKSKLAALQIAFDITSNYSNPISQPTLDLTLNNTISTGLKALQ